ncbi:hypothetical protein ABEB36_009686 [Hypothenemus hampei]|uniref:RRM domain-containing protein n=1 Tax=Hypothenemus hampei TaxID=57062 RepID=A0ABD1EH33_HYPHA
MAKQSKSNRTTNFRNKNNRVMKNKGNKGVIQKSAPKFKKGPIKNKGKKTIQIRDARQKLIQKKRNVSDAREVLTKMAKTQDARNKLDKIRGVRQPVNTPKIKVKAIGSNIVQKVDRNGKISLETNKSRDSSEMNMVIQKQLGLLSPTRRPLKASQLRKPQFTKNVSPMRKTIINEMTRAMPTPRRFDSELYKWANPDLRPAASHLIGSLEPTRQAMRDVMREELLLANRWSDLITPKPLRLQPSGYVDLDAVNDDEEMVMAPPVRRIHLQGSTRVSNIHSRLDSAPIQAVSHGILGQPKTKVVIPAGHRIVVSNLQPSVTEDDIKELFEDIGQLLLAKLVRPGMAEVIYKNLKDAQKAVDTYHNRQLDGQPMKCLLVNKMQMAGSNQPTSTHSDGFSGIGLSSLASNRNKLIPDINTIHKVLFKKK